MNMTTKWSLHFGAEWVRNKASRCNKKKPHEKYQVPEVGNKKSKPTTRTNEARNAKQGKVKPTQRKKLPSKK